MWPFQDLKKVANTISILTIKQVNYLSLPVSTQCPGDH